MTRWFLLLLVACKGDVPDEPAELAVLAPEHRASIVLGETGVYRNKSKVASYEDLTPDRVQQLLATPPANVIVYPEASAEAFAVILRGVSKRNWRGVRISTLRRRERELVELCSGNFTFKVPVEEEDDHVDLSVYVTSERVWIGLSRVNEFVEVMHVQNRVDVEKLRKHLAEYKRSVFFEQRDDIELAFDPKLALETHIGALTATCSSFHRIAIMEPAALAAMPQL